MDGMDELKKAFSKACTKAEHTVAEVTYEYLPGTDYLLESVETAADGYRNVCHYYYSKHNYVDPTGIESIKCDDASIPVWYDLQGRSITTPTSKGIYIVNGKKVMVR